MGKWENGKMGKWENVLIFSVALVALVALAASCCFLLLLHVVVLSSSCRRRPVPYKYPPKEKEKEKRIAINHIINQLVHPHSVDIYYIYYFFK